MSHNANRPSASAPVAEGVDTQQVIRVIAAAVPHGVIKSDMVASGLLDLSISGVVLDPSEPGGGYLAEQELAPGATYIILGVGKGVGIEPGIILINKVAPAPIAAANPNGEDKND